MERQKLYNDSVKVSVRLPMEDLRRLEQLDLYKNRAIVMAINLFLKREQHGEGDIYLMRYAKGVNNALLNPDKAKLLVVLTIPKRIVDRARQQGYIFNRLAHAALLMYLQLQPRGKFDYEVYEITRQCNKLSSHYRLPIY